MDDLKVIASERLSELFHNETQQTTANRLNVQQATVSKWLTGANLPVTEVLFDIAKKYKVSIDWLLGLSDSREIDGLVVEKLTYEQIGMVIDRLIQMGSIIIPDLSQFKIGAEDYDPDEEFDPIIDPDYIKISDRALSFLIRKRHQFSEVDEDSIQYWIDNYVDAFHGVRLLNYKGNVERAIDAHSWSGFKPGDWADLIRDISQMTEQEMEEMITEERERRNNG